MDIEKKFLETVALAILEINGEYPNIGKECSCLVQDNHQTFYLRDRAIVRLEISKTESGINYNINELWRK